MAMMRPALASFAPWITVSPVVTPQPSRQTWGDAQLHDLQPLTCGKSHGGA